MYTMCFIHVCNLYVSMGTWECWYHEGSLTHILLLKDGHPLHGVLLLCGGNTVVGFNWNIVVL